MIISHLDKVNPLKVEKADTQGVSMRVLMTRKEGWEGYIMREFELDEGGHTPRHSHPWPHINYIISGEGKLHLNGEDHRIQAGGFAYLPSNSEHQFSNMGKEKLRFICIVPEHGHM